MKNNLALINEVFQKMPNKYMAVAVASKRAKDLNAGFRPLIDTDATKTTTIALSEIAAGLIVAGPAKPEYKFPVVDTNKREILPVSELTIIDDDIEDTEDVATEIDIADDDIDEVIDEDEVDLEDDEDDIVVDIDQVDDLDDEELEEEEVD
jgi:DNA-directed RNA polymerase omega subunit